MNLNDLIGREGKCFLDTKILSIDESIDDLEGIERLNSVACLYLDMSKPRKNMHLLDSPNLTRSVKTIQINPLDIPFPEFFQQYSVENIIIASENLDYLENISSESICNSVKYMTLIGSERMNLSFLSAGFKNIKKMTLRTFYWDSKVDYSFLNNEGLGESVEELTVSGVFDNLDSIKKYRVLNFGDFSETNLKDISPLRDSLFVKNGSLKKIMLPKTIVWTLIKDNKYVNTETFKELIREGIEVNVPHNPFDVLFEYKNEDLLNTITLYLGLAEGLMNEVSNKLDAAVKDFVYSRSNNVFIKEFDQGRVAKKVVDIDGLIYKITTPELLIREHSIYSADLGEFDNYKPNLKLEERVYNDEIGVLVVENVSKNKGLFNKSRDFRFLSESVNLSSEYDIKRRNIIQSLEKKNLLLAKDNDGNIIFLKDLVKISGANSLYDFIDHFMYVAGLFHGNDFASLALGGVRHGAGNGYGYLEALRNVPSKDFDELLRSEGFNPKDYVSRLNEASSLIEQSALCPVIGDFKLNNTVNGYVLDFDRARFGNPGEDIARFLEQAEFNLTSEEKAHFIDRYIIHRKFHDKIFAKEEAYELKRNYQYFADYENLRTLAGKCCWDQNLNDQYHQQKIKGTINNLRK